MKSMRAVHGHEDGLGLNDSLAIAADKRDSYAGNASHHYRVTYFDAQTLVADEVATINFQHGPRASEGSRPGMTDEALLTIAIDRLEGFQSGPFACEENARALELLREARTALRDRALARAKQGVLGKNERHT